MALFRCFNGNGGGTKLTAQYKAEISAVSHADITILTTGQTTRIQYLDAASRTFTVGGMNIRFADRAWFFNDANGLLIAYRTNSNEAATFTKSFSCDYSIGATYYFCDSIEQPTITIPS